MNLKERLRISGQMGQEAFTAEENISPATEVLKGCSTWSRAIGPKNLELGGWGMRLRRKVRRTIL